ncbi:MAG: NADP-dependent phosphogluconate dehydrogenase [Pseudomonadota bacterium]
MAAQIGVYGLGTMGSALALNMAEHGFDVAVSNREPEWIAPFLLESKGLSGSVAGYEALPDFVAALRTPCVILFMIPSGAPMDAMIAEIAPLLSPGDTIIDGGNADFHDTRRRSAALADRDLHFVGMGVSGGENGARHGPSMMVGGTEHSWLQLRDILEAIAARYEDQPCVAHLGPDGAGHFVKTVHNGIEYADMQTIAEIYGLLHDGAGWDAAQVGALLTRWNTGPLRSYLVEITGKLLAYNDPRTGRPFVDVIRDEAGQKGTGRWTVVEALRLGQSASLIEAAVAARSWSSEKTLRGLTEETLGGERGAFDPNENRLAEAFLAARILVHAQGFRLLRSASDAYDWQLDFARVARIWRAGCIIRSALLDDVARAFESGPPQGELILAPDIAATLKATLPALRHCVAEATGAGHAIPVLSAALQWADTMRQGRGTASIIQAQRDVFGYHGFERLDAEGRHHGPWWDQS